MRKIYRPDLEEHKQQHHELLELLTNQKMAAEANKAGAEPEDVIEFLTN